MKHLYIVNVIIDLVWVPFHFFVRQRYFSERRTTMNKADSWNPRTVAVSGVLDCSMLAMKYLQEYDSVLLHKPIPIDIKDFVINFLQLGIISAAITLPFIKAFVVYAPIDFSDAYSNVPLSVNSGTIILNETVALDSPEGRFILAHEASHWLVHRESIARMQSRYSCCKSFSERNDFLDAEKMERYFAVDPDAQVEIIADNVANALLMPASTFYKYSVEIMEQCGFIDHKIFLGEHPDEENTVITILSSVFDVPAYTVRNRLYTLGLYARS